MSATVKRILFATGVLVVAVFAAYDAPADDFKARRTDGWYFKDQSAPPSAPSNTNRIYSRSSDGKVVYRNKAGVEYPLDAVGGGGAISWTSCSYANSWVDYGAPYDGCAYYKDAEERVWLRGLTKNGTSGTATITTLAAGYRPTNTKLLISYSNGALVAIHVEPDGDIVCVSGGSCSTTSMSLESLSFVAEQ